MTSSNDDIIKAILQYQERMERYHLCKSEDKILYVLGKLSKLPIKTNHLETTGVGRTVNSLKKLKGEVGEAAKDLVDLWKGMVLQEEKAVQETSMETEEDADSVYSSDNENKDCQKDVVKENISSLSDNETDSEEYDTKEEVPRKKDDHIENKSNKYKYDNKNGSTNHNRSRSSSESSDSSESEEERRNKHNKHNSRKRHHSSDSSSSDERGKRSSKQNKSDKDRIREKEIDSHKYNKKSLKEDKDRRHEKKEKHSSSRYESSDKHRKTSETHRGNSDKSETKHKSKKEPEEESRHKSKRESDEERKHKSRKLSENSHSNSKPEKHKREERSFEDSHSHYKSEKHIKQEKNSHSNHKSEKPKKHDEKTDKNSKSSHSSKHKDKESSTHSSFDKKSSKEKDKREKDKHEHRKEKREEKHSELKSNDSPKEEKSEPNISKPSSSKEKARNSDSKEKKIKVKTDKNKSAIKEKIVNGIDSESGASFAEALGMCGPLTASPKKKSSDKSRHSTKADKAVDNGDIESSKSKSKTKSEDGATSSSPTSSLKLVVPDLLKEEPAEPLSLCLSNLLPEITPNYKPLGLSFDMHPKRVCTDDEALSRVMANKNQRTKVYSGNKIVGKVESLFQLCVRILQDNIDALEYTGGVPYLILKPIMERATPDQVFNLEHHNPYLIEDTDELWQLHCQKDFRSKKREEMETWRDMYMRCLDEREARLNAVKANIKQSQDKSIPVRTTKLAYVDSEFVKPPRNIARKQAKNGTITTDRKTTPTQKLSALAKSGDAEKIAVPDPGRRATERSSSSSSAASKPKKAPLMAKTLSFLKNRFRR